jgi:hypothetical protein
MWAAISEAGGNPALGGLDIHSGSPVLPPRQVAYHHLQVIFRVRVRLKVRVRVRVRVRVKG